MVFKDTSYFERNSEKNLASNKIFVDSDLFFSKKGNDSMVNSFVFWLLITENGNFIYLDTRSIVFWLLQIQFLSSII